MAIYRGVGGVNREIKAQYRGVGGVNREIKEQWRGVGGVNRLVFISHTKLFAITTSTLRANSVFTASASNLYIKAEGDGDQTGRVITAINPAGAVTFAAGDIVTVTVSEYARTAGASSSTCRFTAGGVTQNITATGDVSVTCTGAGDISFDLISQSSTSYVSVRITKIKKNNTTIWLPGDNL